MNRKLLSALIFVSTAMAAHAASAADGTITFSGYITAQTCAVNGNGGANNDFLVTLPTVSTSALQTAGETAGRTSFNIALTGCTPDSGTVSAYFEPGIATDSSTGNLKLDPADAPNVQIALLNSDLSPIKAGFPDAVQNSKSVAITGGSAVLEYFAEYVATAAAGPGSANSSVMYTLVYQ